MNTSDRKHWILIAGALGLAALLAAGCGEDASPTVPAPAPAPAPPPAPEPEPPQQHVTAAEVVDRDTIQHFVEDAIEAAQFAISSESDIYSFFDTNFREEGPWKDGPTFIFLMSPQGHSVFHGLFPRLEGRDLSDLEDVNGVLFTAELLAAAAAGGGHVEYVWDNPVLEGDEVTGSPRLSYAATVTLAGNDYVIGAELYRAVTAADVRNRGTLMAFVERAAAALGDHTDDRDTAYAFLDANFRTDEAWRSGEIYVFVLTSTGVSFFQAPDRDWEGTDTSALLDKNGVHLFEEIRDAAEAGGGFVRYLWDNPAVMGDEEDGSPKLSYAVSVTIGGEVMYLGSGIYVTGDGL